MNHDPKIQHRFVDEPAERDMTLKTRAMSTAFRALMDQFQISAGVVAIVPADGPGLFLRCGPPEIVKRILQGVIETETIEQQSPSELAQ